jgi:hypothetical protein
LVPANHNLEGVHLKLSKKTPQGKILPILVQMTNNSDTIWTLDANQVAVVGGSSAPILLATPAEQAARMAGLHHWTTQVSPFAQQMGTFAAYSGALGAVTGAIGAHAKGTSIVDAVQINAAIGGAIGAVLGAAVEFARLNVVEESEEVGQLNEKMKFLALAARSTLYRSYSVSGYVYFDQTDTSNPLRNPNAMLRLLLVMGDPSKDWGGAATGSTYQSPLVCQCDLSLDGTTGPPGSRLCHALRFTGQAAGVCPMAADCEKIDASLSVIQPPPD